MATNSYFLSSLVVNSFWCCKKCFLLIYLFVFFFFARVERNIWTRLYRRCFESNTSTELFFRISCKNHMFKVSVQIVGAAVKRLLIPDTLSVILGMTFCLFFKSLSICALKTNFCWYLLLNLRYFDVIMHKVLNFPFLKSLIVLKLLLRIWSVNGSDFNSYYLDQL